MQIDNGLEIQFELPMLKRIAQFGLGAMTRLHARVELPPRGRILPLGLRACWSNPIKSADGRVIGAFAFYYPRPRGPTSLERQAVDACLSLCTIPLEHEETRSRAYEQAFTDPLTRLPNRARIQHV
jgi:hypothetical protein